MRDCHAVPGAQVRALVVSDEQLPHVEPGGAHSWPSMSVEPRLCQSASALLDTLESSCNSRCRAECLPIRLLACMQPQCSSQLHQSTVRLNIRYVIFLLHFSQNQWRLHNALQHSWTLLPVFFFFASWHVCS